MYHVLSTGTTSIILYLLSFFLYRAGFYSRNLHSRIWNFIMAAIFIPAVLAGLFLALQITYKWEIPFIKIILKWHVETGIAFAFTGIFHFLWHFRYFFDRYREQVIPPVGKSYPARSAKEYSINLFLIGFVSTAVQLILMREMMNIAGGYELIAGTFLASWLIGSAAGSFAARRSEMNDLKKINLVFAASQFISLALLIFLDRIFFITGESPGFLAGMIYTLIVLLPCTFISGFSFLRILNASAESGMLTSGKSFSIETAGGVLSGIALSAAGAYLLNNYQLLLIILIIFCTYTLLDYILKTKVNRIAALLLCALLILLVIVFNPDRFFRQLLLPGIRVDRTTDTPYGNITEGSYGGEKNLYYDHHLFRWQNDEAEREENIHYAMLQHRDPHDVLLVSGDIRSSLQEVLKYNLRSVTFVERDPVLIKRYGFGRIGNNTLLRTVSTDALRFITKTSEKYDVIIVNLPPPSTLMLNRFYTTEFFRKARERLRKGGVLMCSPGSGSNYFNSESVVLYSSVFNSLSSVFKNVLPIVGNKLYYIASDESLTTTVCSRVDSLGITNSYVNRNFLSDDLVKMKSEEMISLIDRNTRQNSLLFPVACFHFQNYQMTMENQQRIPSLLLILLIFLSPLLTIRPSVMVMYTSAGALAGFEIIMLLILQSSAGNMYQFTGLILAGFMAGLALGSGISDPLLKYTGKTMVSAILILFYLITGMLTDKLLNINSLILEIIMILILSLIPSFLTGRMFRIMTEKRGTGSASMVYSSDMAGAALGFIAVSGFAIPLLGIRVTLLLLAALIFGGFLFGTISDK
jgi:spermidine synthase